MKRLVCVTLLALVACPAAAPHGGGAARGFVSEVQAVKPAVSGLSVRVLEGDDQLELQNDSGSEVEILGYGEQYLSFRADGVFRNARSPATYLNADRYAKVTLPAGADSKAAPVWQKVASGSLWTWHDHRIHWMSPIDPPQVRRARDRPHRIFAWRVPGRADGKPLAITGTLEYVPTSSRPVAAYVAAAVVVGVSASAIGAFVLARRRRRPAAAR